MIRPQTKRLAETISSAAGMTLFLIFAVCCLIMITVAASAYKRINDSYEQVFNSTAALRYVSNKLHACESAELLSDKELLIKNEGFQTLIYERDGELYERLFPEEAEIKAESGEQLFSVGDFSFNMNGELLEVIVSGEDGESFRTLCRIKSFE